MKVILLKDKRSVGKKYDVIDVADGFAQNQLIPQKIAKIATEQAIKDISAMKAAAAKIQADLNKKIHEALDDIKSPISFEVKANEKGGLFKAIHKSDIVEKIMQISSIEIPDTAISLEPVKEIGDKKFQIEIGDRKFSMELSVKPLE